MPLTARSWTLTTTAFLLFAGDVGATDYFVSPHGDDSNPGTFQQPWKTVAKVNTVALSPGDRVLFEGPGWFSGKLLLDAQDAGTADQPVVLTSYGGERATICPRDDAALEAYNCAGFEIRNLAFCAFASPADTSPGVAIWMDLDGGVKLEHIRVDDVEISGFGGVGLYLGSNGTGHSGYRDVRITKAKIHHNRRDGLFTWGEYTTLPGAEYAHEDVYVGYCEFYENSGIPGQNTGNGLFLKDVDGGVIEFCEVYGNGSLGGLVGGGGPFGIWALQSNDITIQFNESHHNGSGGTRDGGGFDLDGGVTNSVIQYNYSHDNEGPGFALMSGSWARPFHGNTVRYNISQNDARLRDGAISNRSDAGNPVRQVDVYHNTVFVGAGSNASAVRQEGAQVTDVRFLNNILVTTGGRALLEVEETGGLAFLGNDYFSSGDPFLIHWGAATFGKLKLWRKTTGQEVLFGIDVGTDADPILASPGGGGTIGDPTRLHLLRAYRLLSHSPLIDEGLPLRALFGIDPGRRDFYGGSLTAGGRSDVGAHEWLPPK